LRTGSRDGAQEESWDKHVTVDLLDLKTLLYTTVSAGLSISSDLAHWMTFRHWLVTALFQLSCGKTDRQTAPTAKPSLRERE